MTDLESKNTGSHISEILIQIHIHKIIRLLIIKVKMEPEAEARGIAEE